MNKHFVLSSVINIHQFCTFSFVCFTRLILESQTPPKAWQSVAVVADGGSLRDRPANRSRTEARIPRIPETKSIHAEPKTPSYHMEGEIPEGTASAI